MSKDLTRAKDVLRYFFPALKAKYEELHPDAELIITHVDRTPIEQLLLFVQGRLPNYPGEIVTWKDGFVGKSKHNALPLSEAIDVGVRIKATGKMTWSLGKEIELLYILKIGALVVDLGYDDKIKWGGVFGDNYHFETR